MARICYDHPYINVTEKSVLQAGSTAVYQPDYKLGMEIKCDSGIYRYLQANGAVAEGYACKYLRSGLTVANFDATPMNGTTSGTTPTDVAICVATGGLADNQQGWFWIGHGEDYCYLASAITSYTQLSAGTSTTLGQLGAETSGDRVCDLIAIDSATSSGLRLCRSTRLLCTNFTVSTG